jgi:hypothetical protein
MIDPEEKEFQIATGILEDCRRFIAAHKVQRWEAAPSGPAWSIKRAFCLEVLSLRSTAGRVSRADGRLKPFQNPEG